MATGGIGGFFCSAPQDFVVLGVFCASFPPRETSIFYRHLQYPRPHTFLLVASTFLSRSISISFNLQFRLGVDFSYRSLRLHDFGPTLAENLID